jgi:predicted nucleic acid-binding protein
MYCVDTSAWLDGWNRFYPPKVFHTLWDAMNELVIAGEIISAEEVYIELAKRDDDLHRWVKGRKEMLQIAEMPIQETVAELLGKYPRLVDTLKNRSQADPFVIATAIFRKATVVTGESFGTVQRPRIPFVCQAENVPCINFLEMIVELNLTF